MLTRRRHRGQDDYIKVSSLREARAQLSGFSHWPCLVHIFVAHPSFFSSFTLCLSHLPTHVIVSHLALSCHSNASGFDKNRFIFGVAFIAAIIFPPPQQKESQCFSLSQGPQIKKETNCGRVLRCDWHFFVKDSPLSLVRLCIKASLVQKKRVITSVISLGPLFFFKGSLR